MDIYLLNIPLLPAEDACDPDLLPPTEAGLFAASGSSGASVGSGGSTGSPDGSKSDNYEINFNISNYIGI